MNPIVIAAFIAVGCAVVGLVFTQPPVDESEGNLSVLRLSSRERRRVWLTLAGILALAVICLVGV